MRPPKLQPGDQVAIISPSNTVATRQDVVTQACRNFEQVTGLKTVVAPNALEQHYYSGGTIEQRINDFHWALRNPKIKAIIFSVGGNTAIELVDHLDYELIKQHPKIIAGISDATTLLNSIAAKTGLITFLGIEFLSYASETMDYETASIKKSWFDGNVGSIQPNPNWRNFNDLPTGYTGWQAIRSGAAEGKIIGGNYGSFAQLYHTEYTPDITGSILVMEAFMKHKKGIHQELAQLKLWGAFDKINGLIMGYCAGSDDPTKIGDDRPMSDLILEAAKGYDFPIIWIGEIGHTVENIMLPINAKARLDVTNKQFEILEAVTI